MGPLAELVGKVIAPDSPWLLVVALALLVAAGGIGRRLFASLSRIGARVGSLERVRDSERTRRRQLEEVLRDAGLPLPYWPGDPAELHARRQPCQTCATRARVLEDEDEDLDVPEGTAEYRRPPIPPFPEAERARLARHSR